MKRHWALGCLWVALTFAAPPTFGAPATAPTSAPAARTATAPAEGMIITPALAAAYDAGPLPALAPTPASSPVTLVAVPVAVSGPLPPAETFKQPRVLPSEGQHPIGLRAEADRPPSASVSSSPPWPTPVLPTAPLARGTSPDASKPPAVLTRTPMDAGKAAPADDPTAEQALRTYLVFKPLPRASLVPFLRLVIPDPFELFEAVRLRQAPPEPEERMPLVAPPPSKPKLPEK